MKDSRIQALSRLAIVLVSGAALGSGLLHYSMLAQTRLVAPSNELFRSPRITPADPNFRIASATVLHGLAAAQKGNQIAARGTTGTADSMGNVVVDYNAWKWATDNSFYIYKIISIRPGIDQRIRTMTPTQLAVLETLFQEADLTRAKNVTITSTGFEGSATVRELGLSNGQVETMTRARLQRKVALTNRAIGGL